MILRVQGGQSSRSVRWKVKLILREGWVSGLLGFQDQGYFVLVTGFHRPGEGSSCRRFRYFKCLETLYDTASAQGCKDPFALTLTNKETQRIGPQEYLSIEADLPQGLR